LAGEASTFFKACRLFRQGAAFLRGIQQIFCSGHAAGKAGYCRTLPFDFVLLSRRADVGARTAESHCRVDPNCIIAMAQLWSLRRQGCIAGSDLAWTVTNLQQAPLAQCLPKR